MTRYYSRSQGKFVDGEPPVSASGVSGYVDQFTDTSTPDIIQPTVQTAPTVQPTVQSPEVDPETIVRNNPPQESKSITEKAGGTIINFLKSLVKPTTDFLSGQEEKMRDPNYMKDITNFIPVVNLLKSDEGRKAAANVASFMVPFGKGTNIATKTLLPGAAVGGLQASSQEGATLPKIVGGAALGAAGAGALNVAGKAVSGLTKNLPKKIMESVFKEPIKATKAGVKSGETLGQKALAKGEVGTTDQIYQKALTETQKLEDELQNKLLNSDVKVSTVNIRKSVEPMVNELIQAGDQGGANSILERISSIEKASGTKIPVGQANEIKRTIYDEVRRAYGSQGGTNTELIKNLGRAFKEEIAKVPGVADINKNLSYYGRVADSMADKIAKTGRNNLISLTDFIMGTGGATAFGPVGLAGVAAKKALESTVGQTAIAKGLSAVGNKLPTISPNITGQVGARAGEGVTDLVASPQTNQPTSDQSQNNSNAPSNQGILSPITDNIPQTTENATRTGYTLDQLSQASTKARMDGKDKIADQIDKIYDQELEYQKSLKTESKQLSGPNSVLLNKAQTATKAIDRIDTVLQKNPRLTIEKALNPLSQEGRLMGQDIVSAIDILGYFRTGAAITPDQRKDYVYMFPSALDSEATVKDKLQRLREEFAGYEQGLLKSTGTSDLPAITDTSQTNFNEGAVPKTAQVSSMTLPKITQAFGVKNPKVERFSKGGINRGVDISAKTGTPLYVPEGEWKVTETYSRAKGKGYVGNRTNTGYGNSVVIKNTKTGEVMRLSHLSSVGVKPGQILASGSLIGKSGATGNVTGSHLDLEYKTSKGKLADASKTKYVSSIFRKAG
jgi:murein DD-endopeptidase MepM/ murein hydrolase activator NlpD